MYIMESGGAQLRYTVYVDDILCTYPAEHVNPAGLKMHLAVVAHLQKKYELDDDGLTGAQEFIGLNLTWAPWIDGHRQQCALGMPNKLNALLETYNFDQAARATHTPGAPGQLLSNALAIPAGPEGDAERKRATDFEPRAFVGLALRIIRGYRPDIAYQAY
jgi:hypothetical protein